MGFTEDKLGRLTLASGYDGRSVCVGGDSAKLGGKSCPILYARAFREAGSGSLFRCEREAGLASVPDDEDWFAVNHLASTPAALREDIPGKIWLPGDGDCVDHHVYYPTDDGNVEWELYLTREPHRWPDSKLVFVPVKLATSPGVTWHHQLALTKQEIADGHTRDETVVDSWAVMTDKRDNWRGQDGQAIVSYGTGSLGHLFRPWFADAAGQRHWCTWAVVDGVPVGILIPAGLAYPGVLGPTFGYTDAAGTTQSGLSPNQLVGVLNLTPAANGTLDSLSAYTKWVYLTGKYTLGIYSGGGTPYTLLGASAEINQPGGPAWDTSTVASHPAVAAGTNYHLGIHSKDWQAMFYKTAGGGTWGFTAGTGYAYSAGNMPTPIDITTSTNQIAMYATYTEGGGAAKPWLYARRNSRVVGVFQT